MHEYVDYFIVGMIAVTMYIVLSIQYKKNAILY